MRQFCNHGDIIYMKCSNRYICPLTVLAHEFLTLTCEWNAASHRARRDCRATLSPISSQLKHRTDVKNRRRAFIVWIRYTESYRDLLNKENMILFVFMITPSSEQWALEARLINPSEGFSFYSGCQVSCQSSIMDSFWLTCTWLV